MCTEGSSINVQLARSEHLASSFSMKTNHIKNNKDRNEEKYMLRI